MRRERLAFTIDLLGEAVLAGVGGRAVSGRIPAAHRGAFGRREILADRHADRPRPPPRPAEGQRVGEALVAVQPVRPHRPRRHQPGRPRAAAADPAARAQAGRVRQHRHGAARVQGRDAPDLPRGVRRAGVPRLARRRHRDPGVPEERRRRPRVAARLGQAPRHAGVGAARERRVLGLRDDHRRPEQLAHARVGAQGRDGRQLRGDDGVPVRPRRGPAPRDRQPQRAEHRAALALAERNGLHPRATSSRCCTAWPTPSSRR